MADPFAKPFSDEVVAAIAQLWGADRTRLGQAELVIAACRRALDYYEGRVPLGTDDAGRWLVAAARTQLADWEESDG